MFIRFLAAVGILALLACIVALLQWTETQDAFRDVPGDELRDRARARLDDDNGPKPA